MQLKEKTMTIQERAKGCLMGQLAGDALGSLVEFQSAATILRRYPEGVREMKDGGTWNTLAGQPTDDSEMALLLARLLVEEKSYDKKAAFETYRFWLDSRPFDCGATIAAALRGSPNPESQANGALMRISPLGIFGANFHEDQVAEWAIQDASLTHPNKICLEANTLFAMAISHAIRSTIPPEDLYKFILEQALERNVDEALLLAIEEARKTPPADFMRLQGWVLIAFQNALFQLLHAKNPEEGIINTVMAGGDADTNAAICGALLGAVYGLSAIPKRWQKAILNCRPREGAPGVFQPRPLCFWPVDALDLAEKLVAN